MSAASLYWLNAKDSASRSRRRWDVQKLLKTDTFETETTFLLHSGVDTSEPYREPQDDRQRQIIASLSRLGPVAHQLSWYWGTYPSSTLQANGYSYKLPNFNYNTRAITIAPNRERQLESPYVFIAKSLEAMSFINFNPVFNLYSVLIKIYKNKR